MRRADWLGIECTLTVSLAVPFAMLVSDSILKSPLSSMLRYLLKIITAQ
jgi:hypothetical protein